ncbi:hypothetical protein JOC77_004117 [Peribacillus deserti]|uniref:Uncharacterized protein n=1 Tax=Peribacillus deserti TaxID=673318 RepID=A0ABS2QNA4_9BACI|nr:hypothetical protein [Peribacillus deserti]MBM7694642.1 hypothetical protein [Peribacillus deserti]
MKEIYSETITTTNSVLIRSKKKRLRKKMLKKSEASQVQVILLDSISKKETASSSQKNFDGLPVTFLLKVGKKYLAGTKAVRYYYKASETQYYKNRSELEMSLMEESKNLPAAQQTEFWDTIAANQKA